ncbi:hypothetical protein QVD17_28502 [Tagetes erecta]|uniref:Uncharacterized protein n=1 Tax=Tagetes erecta TaxID=13708 RepID=A0AAD8KDY3_TARER|nr:hypothetical protein QVD17_28502 [Tagetes erecta]
MLIDKHNLSIVMDACMKKLCTLGWEEYDARHQTVLFLFGESADIRKVWLQVQPSTCEPWVKNVGAKHGWMFITPSGEIEKKKRKTRPNDIFLPHLRVTHTNTNTNTNIELYI